MKNPSLYKKKADSHWYVRKMVDGKRSAWCTGTKDKKEATRLGRLWSQELEANNTRVLALLRRRRRYSTLGEAITAYLDSGLRRCNDDTAQDNVRSLRMLAHQGGDLDEGASLDELTPDLVGSFYSHRLAGKKTTTRLQAARTANSIYRTARSIFGKRVIKRGVFKGLELPLESLADFRECEMEAEGDVTYVAPNPGLIQALILGSANLRRSQPATYCAFLVSMAAGLRKGEASWLEFTDITQENGAGFVAHVKPKSQRLTKNKKSRRVPIHTAVVDELITLGEGGRYVIPGTENHRVNVVWRNLATWMKDLGWDRTKAAHELRKFYGAQVSTELGLYAAQKYLGHSSPAITSKYYADLTELNLPTLALPFTGEVEK